MRGPQRRKLLRIPLFLWEIRGLRAALAEAKPEVTGAPPVIGGPKYSFVNGRYRRRGLDVDWIAEQTIKRHETPIQCPVISIYSKHDAIVHWSASIDRWTPGAKHFEVDCTHTAFGFHPPTFEIIKDELNKIHL